MLVVVYPKDTEKWKQFTTITNVWWFLSLLLCIPKILKNESNSQLPNGCNSSIDSCCVSQRYWKMKAIHNIWSGVICFIFVVVYPKDTEKWKQFTTVRLTEKLHIVLLCIPKILKNESNSQQNLKNKKFTNCCCVSQRYWKMKAIHNSTTTFPLEIPVVVYPKDTEKWKQFTTILCKCLLRYLLLCIPKILKNESNSQRFFGSIFWRSCCCVSQRYWKMKAIHNHYKELQKLRLVVVYPKDTEKWKQFTTHIFTFPHRVTLLCIPKILKNESNSQHQRTDCGSIQSCCVSQRYWKMKAIHNIKWYF